MNNLLNRIQSAVRLKKGLLIFVLILTLAMIVLGVIAAINFSGGVLVVDLSHISYIQFLKDDCSFISLMFKLLLSLLIFLIIIALCGSKNYLFPLGVLFYCYLVYSQTVIFVSLIMVYGFFNCVIFALFLLIYILLVCSVFVLLTIEISCCGNNSGYFKTLCNWHQSLFIFYLITIILLTFIFCLILTILKSFVLLLVYQKKLF